jgi:hypothetical protein
VHGRRERAVEGPALRFVLADEIGVHAHVDEMIRIESQVHALARLQAADEQAGADEEHQRTGDLTDDQQILQAPLPHTSGARAVAVVEQVAHAGARRP